MIEKVDVKAGESPGVESIVSHRWVTFVQIGFCLLFVTGLHVVEVTYDDVPIPNSPFKVAVTEGCQPSRVQAQGPGLKEAFTNKPNVFTVVTR